MENDTTTAEQQRQDLTTTKDDGNDCDNETRAAGQQWDTGTQFGSPEYGRYDSHLIELIIWKGTRHGGHYLGDGNAGYDFDALLSLLCYVVITFHVSCLLVKISLGL